MVLNHICFSRMFLATMILILASNGKAKAGADSPFCAQTNPGSERDLCSSLVNGAKTWEAALTNVIRAALKEVELVKPLIDGLGAKLPSSLRQISKDSIVETCQESYANVIDEFNGALQNIKNGDKKKALNFQLSAALSSLSDCTDGLSEFGVTSVDISRFQAILEKYASLSLAVSSTKGKN